MLYNSLNLLRAHLHTTKGGAVGKPTRALSEGGGFAPQPLYHGEKGVELVAIYHCSVKNIGRSSGKSAVASSAYRSGEKLHDEELGKTFDYTSKDNVVYSEIILCENAPKEYQDRQKLWNEVQKVEKAKDARLAREWEVALPNELPLEKAKELARGYAQSLADEGMCVDYAIHWKDGNHHAHIMGTTRAIKENGEWAPKTRKVYDLDENGQKIPLIDKKTGEQKVDKQNRKQWKSHKDDYTDWNKTEKVEEWRERWAEHCNRYLEKEQQIDHRSYERQGIEQVPTMHEGYVARQMEQRGEVSEICQMNREIKSFNQRLKEFLEQKARDIRDRIAKYRGTVGTVGRTGQDNTRPSGQTIAERAREQLRTNRTANARDNQSAIRELQIADTDKRIAELKRNEQSKQAQSRSNPIAERKPKTEYHDRGR